MRTSTGEKAAKFVQELLGGTSYCSAHQSRLEFGLGASARPISVHVRWPSGIEQTLTDVSEGSLLTVREPMTPVTASQAVP